MKYLIYMAVALLALSSCQEKVDLSDIEGREKLVVYSFPGKNDTLFIYVSKSLPTNSNKKQTFKLTGVKCSYEGQQRNVNYKGTGNDPILSEVYYVTGSLRSGTEVRIEVSAEDLPTVYATSVLPPKPEILSTAIDTVFLKGEWFTQLRVQFSNDADAAYYGVRVIGVEKTEYQTSEEIQSVNTNSEPLLNGNSDADISFGTSNDYYHNMYIFENSQIKGTSYTLHLNLQNKKYVPCYKVQLYRITKDYYSFLKSLNDVDNNSLSNYGMSLMSPTYTNVTNGIGVLGLCSVVESPWIGSR